MNINRGDIFKILTDTQLSTCKELMVVALDNCRSNSVSVSVVSLEKPKIMNNVVNAKINNEEYYIFVGTNLMISKDKIINVIGNIGEESLKK